MRTFSLRTFVPHRTVCSPESIGVNAKMTRHMEHDKALHFNHPLANIDEPATYYRYEKFVRTKWIRMCAEKCEYGRRTQTVMIRHQLIAFAFSLFIYLDKSNYLRNRITYRWTIIHHKNPATKIFD